METHTFILLVFFLILIFTNDNRIETFKPNEEIFSSCSGKHTKGETYYLNSLNYQEKDSNKFFQALLKTTGENKNKNYFGTPICEKKHEFKDNYMVNNKIIDYQDNTDEGLPDPFDKYAHPKDDSSILYSTEIQDQMLKQKKFYN